MSTLVASPEPAGWTSLRVGVVSVAAVTACDDATSVATACAVGAGVAGATAVGALTSIGLMVRPESIRASWHSSQDPLWALPKLPDWLYLFVREFDQNRIQI